ncbi:MAG TPA: lipopolysaccharide biosynthesis protein, partial [Propionibacteriaceae bacterium]|nr:lipopolysaccharide biosynthesis protein [Propionibacteriaceae bacterium]
MTDSAPQPGLGRRAIRGAAVTMAGQAAKIAIQVLSVVILARLLAPSDYGLLVMVTAVIGVTDIFRDFGLSSAAIQAPVLSRKEQINLFWLNTGLGSTLSLITFLAAPALAAFYGRPELIPLTHVMSGMFLINGLATQYRADLSRRMLFRRLALADVSGSAVGLVVAVTMASHGFGVWSLAAQQLTQLAVMLALVVIGAGWLPRLYDRSVSVRHFLGFGWRLAGSQLVVYVGNNIDTVMLGLRVNTASLGLYNRAYQLVMQPLGQIRGPLNTVAIPVLSQLQDEEERFNQF